MRPVDIVEFYKRPTRDEIVCEFAVVRLGPAHFLHLEKKEIWYIRYVLDFPKRRRRGNASTAPAG
jgi:hypothetical protein